MRDDTWAPTWLPLDTAPWRLVNMKNGEFARDPKKGTAYVFESEKDAVAFALKARLMLAEERV
jgi:hypothetical protein